MVQKKQKNGHDLKPSANKISVEMDRHKYFP